MTVPLTAACALFADDMILVFLGPKWKAAAAIFRFLAPTILVFAIANPLSWLVMSLGMVRRALKMGLVIAPLLILAYVIGLPYGPKGVALAYSATMLLWVFPVIAWSVHGTVISIRDVLLTVSRPLDLEHRGCGAGLCSKVSLRSNVVSLAPLCAGNCGPSGHVSWDAVVRNRAKGTLLGSASRIKEAVSGRRREPGFGISKMNGKGKTIKPSRNSMGLASKRSTWVQGAMHAMSQSRHLRTYLGRPYLLANIWIWNHLPDSFTRSDLGSAYGAHLHRLIQLRSARTQNIGTFFFRNRPELELLTRLVGSKRQGSTIHLTILGCSKGAEVYSFLYSIRTARPDLDLRLYALDIDPRRSGVCEGGYLFPQESSYPRDFE